MDTRLTASQVPKHWCRLPREIMESPSLEILKREVLELDNLSGPA